MPLFCRCSSSSFPHPRLFKAKYQPLYLTAFLLSSSSPLRFSSSPPSYFHPLPPRSSLSSVGCCSSAMSGSGSSHPSPLHKYTNRLASEHSPYLLQHAHNPVDWHPWGDEAFENARKRNVPIFLSIGYSTCHWCHVMEVESFENEEVAKMLNEWFVSIKVDREERPDVDKVYMTYVQTLYGGGGWPLSAFLSPSLKPLMGGTYFPPDDKYGRPGFKTILRKVKEAWETNQDTLEKGGDLAIQQLSEALALSTKSRELSKEASQRTLEICAKELSSSYDPMYGGFGTAPKFPRPVEINLMLYQSKKMTEEGKDNEANKYLKIVCHSLQGMSRGGIHDHVGGGFHRYSVDECWHVPHFEKMLYDQGQLVNTYIDTYSITKDTLYSSVARDILDYLRRQMIGPEGEIYSAEDADSAEYDGAARKKEGAFYVWTSKEIDDMVGDYANIFKDHYYVKASGNCDLSSLSDPHNEFKEKNVLFEKKDIPTRASKLGMPVDEYSHILGMSRQKLFNVRSSRPKPHLDDKVIVSWNGLAISSLARASQILKAEPTETKYYFPVIGCNPQEYLEVAESATKFIRDKLYDVQTKRLRRSFRNGPSKAPGFLDDYAFLICGLLDLFEYGGKTEWLTWAIELQATQDELFLDREGGGYFNTPGEDLSVLLRMKEDHDGAEPSGNSVSAINLIRLSSMIAGEKSKYYKDTAAHLLAVFEKRLTNQSIAVPLMCCAVDMLSVPSRKQVVLVGNKSNAEFNDMVAAVCASYDPNRTVIQIDPNNKEDIEFWESNNLNIAQMARGSPADKAVVTHLCQDFVCRAPVSDIDALRALLNKETISAPSSC